jgi:hypothetical protein
MLQRRRVWTMEDVVAATRLADNLDMAEWRRRRRLELGGDVRPDAGLMALFPTDDMPIADWQRVRDRQTRVVGVSWVDLPTRWNSPLRYAAASMPPTSSPRAAAVRAALGANLYKSGRDPSDALERVDPKNRR